MYVWGGGEGGFYLKANIEDWGLQSNIAKDVFTFLVDLAKVKYGIFASEMCYYVVIYCYLVFALLEPSSCVKTNIIASLKP